MYIASSYLMVWYSCLDAVCLFVCSSRGLQTFFHVLFILLNIFRDFHLFYYFSYCGFIHRFEGCFRLRKVPLSSSFIQFFFISSFSYFLKDLIRCRFPSSKGSLFIIKFIFFDFYFYDLVSTLNAVYIRRIALLFPHSI